MKRTRKLTRGMLLVLIPAMLMSGCAATQEKMMDDSLAGSSGMMQDDAKMSEESMQGNIMPESMTDTMEAEHDGMQDEEGKDSGMQEMKK